MKMNNYIEATCIGSPLGLPEFNEDTEQWEVFFEENEDNFNPYFQRDIISYSCESAQEATDIYNHYNKHAVSNELEGAEEVAGLLEDFHEIYKNVQDYELVKSLEKLNK